MALVIVLCLCSTQTILILLLHSLLVGVKAQMQPSYYTCSMINNYTEGSIFQSNLNQLLYSPLNNNGNNSIYTKASEGEDPDKVYGVFLCRGDVVPKDCKNCIDVARERIQRECPLKKQAIIWFNECLVRYSNVSFASMLDTSVGRILYSVRNVSQPEQFMGNLSAMFDNLTAQATTINLNLKYADNSDVINDFQTLYGMVQCLPDLSAVNCVTCLKTAFSGIRNLSLSIAKVPGGVRILLPSCSFRYELYPFFYASVPPSTSLAMIVSSNPAKKSPCLVVFVFFLLLVIFLLILRKSMFMVKIWRGSLQFLGQSSYLL